MTASPLTQRQAAAVARSTRLRIDACSLDLTGWVVTTEAAAGAYAATAVAAAAAGGEVYALARDTAHGTVDDVERDVVALAAALEVDKGLSIVTERDALPIERTDLITNSGSVRPIDAAWIERLPSTALIALMYEGWEARAGDVDYAAAARHGIPVVAVDEHHPACGAFAFVGDLAVAAALRRGWPIRGMNVAVLSDNAFAEPIEDALAGLGAAVAVSDPSAGAPGADLAIVAVTPRTVSPSALDPQTLSAAVVESGAFACVQLWGDLDRSVLSTAGVAIEPVVEPEQGHQGIAMSEAGFEAVVRLQVAGLAAAVHYLAVDGPLAGLGYAIGDGSA